MYGGKIFNHSAHRDGTPVYTGYVREVRNNNTFIIVETYEGHQYICHKILHHKEKADVIL